MRQNSEHLRTLLLRSPLLVVGTKLPDGRTGVSAHGDLPGFLRELNEYMILIPDRLGHNRLDLLPNFPTNPRVGLLFCPEMTTR